MDPYLSKGLILGAIAVSSAVLGLFFLRFWILTRDQLFIMFSCAFFLDAISRILTALIAMVSDEHPLIYILRLLAYGLIIGAVAQKNLKKSSHP